MNLILFDNWCRPHLLPLTYTRPAADIRVGITTLREKWERVLNMPSSTLTESYLQEKFPLRTSGDNLLVAGALLPNPQLLEAIRALQPGDALDLRNFFESYLQSECAALPLRMIRYTGDYDFVSRPYHIFLLNGQEIEHDYADLTAGRASQPLSPTNTVIGDPSRIFLEEGAVVEASTLNTTGGPIYIGRDAEVMEGCRLRGPIALCEHAVTKMDAKIYGYTTIGPYSKVGGELSETVIFGYSNKAHDGFIGNAVIGEWCNLGADTNCSNLKNNYSEVRLWDYATRRMEATGEQFCGLIMGDHAKCGINSMFNTGTVVGVGAGLFGTGFHPKFVPSFSFGSPGNLYETHDFGKFINTAQTVMGRRNKILDEIEQNLLKRVYEIALHCEN